MTAAFAPSQLTNLVIVVVLDVSPHLFFCASFHVADGVCTACRKQAGAV